MEKKQNPLVSVIIPTYNRGRLISETIDSVLHQTLDDFEIIIVDDGSTDNTKKVIEACNDSRFVYHLRKWSGLPAVARNRGLEMARGKYIAFLDSDDIWYPEKLEKQVSVLSENPELGWCYCCFESFDSDTGEIIPKYDDQRQLPQGDITTHLLYRNFIGSLTPLVRSEVLKNVGYFNENKILRGREDWELWLRIAGRYPIGLVPEILGKYRIYSHTRDNVNAGDNMKKIFHANIAALSCVTVDNPDTYSPLLQSALGSLYANNAILSITQGNKEERKEARKLILQSIVNAIYNLKLILIFPLFFVKGECIQILYKAAKRLRVLSR